MEGRSLTLESEFESPRKKTHTSENSKKLTHDSNGGWDKVKVLDSVKRKFFSANTLLAQGEKPRSQSRAESASRKSNAAAASGGGGELTSPSPRTTAANRRRARSRARRKLRRLPLCSSLRCAHGRQVLD